jgi:predicted Zn-dependent protease
MIPKEFVINNIKYKVNILESSEKDLDYNLGDYCNILHEIRLAKNVRIEEEDIELSEDNLLLTFLHELGHCFGYYYNDDNSEEFANAFSHFMFDYIKSKK